MALDLREAEAWDSPATAAGLAWERVNLKARPWEKHSFRGLGDGWVLFRASSFQPPFLPEHTSPQLPFTHPISPVPAFHSAHISDTLKTQEKGVPSAIQAGQCSGEKGSGADGISTHTTLGQEGGHPIFQEESKPCCSQTGRGDMWLMLLQFTLCSCSGSGGP